MTDDQHYWACANTLHKDRGTLAPRFVAERIGSLALAGDVQGVAAWKEIAMRLDKLLHAADAVQ